MKTPTDDTPAALVGVENMALPKWIAVDQKVAESGLWRTLRALPAGVRMVIAMAWRTSSRLTLLTAALAVAGGAATALGLWSTAEVFSRLLAEGPTPHRVTQSLPAVGLVVICFAVRAVLQSAGAAAEAVLKPKVEQHARDQAHTVIAGVDLIAFEDSDYADLVRQGLERGMRSIEGCIEFIISVSGALIHLAAAVVTTAFLHPLLAPLVLLAVVPDLWASAKAAKQTYASYVSLVSRTLRMAVASELLTQRDTAAELRACTAVPALLTEYRRISEQLTTETSRLEVSKTRVRLLGRGMAGIGTGLAYGALALLLYTGSLPLAMAGAAVVAMRMASSALANTMLGINSLYENILYLDLYTDLVQQTIKRTRPSSAAKAPRDPARIELRALSFSYPGQHSPAVHEVDLTVHRGQVIALVGENGSGKSTLAKLITGLYQPNAGQVFWDGVDLTAVDEQSIYEQVAMVMQEPARWPMTARNNIRIGRIARPDPYGRALSLAARESGAQAVIEQLPAGLETVLSRRFTGGRDLSGGQWQRLSVGRGLYRDAPLLVADEPTAAMDARAEHAVFQSLQQLSRTGRDGSTTRTTILITHRLANIRNADLIIVMDHGRIIEQGTHDELMKVEGTYATMFGLQAAAFQAGPQPVQVA